jgi:hypothetical protein
MRFWASYTRNLDLFYLVVEALPIDNSLKKNILKFVLGSSLDLDLKLTIPKFLCFFKLCQTSGK